MCIGKYYTYMLGVYVTRSVFSTAVGERTSFNELLNFFEKNRSRTAMCLIVRAADNPINSQAVVKKRLSKFELLKCCCRIFQQRLQTDFVSNQRAIQVLQRIASAANLQYTFARKRDVNFLYDTSQTFGAHGVYNQSAVVVKRSSIHSDIIPNSDTRHE